MKVEKPFAALVLCLAVLWASRFGPYSCEAGAAFPGGGDPSWQAPVVAGGLIIMFLFLPAYDFVAYMTYRFGLDRSFDHLEIYPGDPPAPNTLPVSLKTKLLLLYPLELAAVILVLLPLWTKVVYCG